MKTFCPRHDNREKGEGGLIIGGNRGETRQEGGDRNENDNATIDKTDEDNISKDPLLMLDIKVKRPTTSHSWGKLEEKN